MEQLEKQFSGMCLDKDTQEQNKHQESPEQEQIKHNFSETTFETNQDARSYETHELLHRTKSK